jgi:hypothetical protein
MDYEVGIDITVEECKAINCVTGWVVDDDADMRRAIHDMIVELAKYKDIDISDIDMEDWE